MLAHNGNSGESLQSRHVTAAGHDHVGRNSLVVAGPLPDTDALRAVFDGSVHRQPLRCCVFACDHDVDVVAAAQAVVHHRQQAVCIRRKVDTHDLGLLVHNVVDKAGILVREAVVILAPDMRGQKVVQRGHLPPPWQARCDLQPFGVLVEHRVNDVDERLVAVEEPVPPRQQVPLEPALALVLAEHFHHLSGWGEELVARQGRSIPLAFRDFTDRLEAVGERLVRTKYAKISTLTIQLRHIAQETPEHMRVTDCPKPPVRAPRPRSRGTQASAGRGAECRRWRGGSRPCVGHPWAQGRRVPVLGAHPD